MRLILITHELSMTGAAWMLYRLGAYCVGRGDAVTVVAPQHADGPLRKAFQELGAAIVQEVVPARFDLAIANTMFAAPHVCQLASHVKTIWWLHEGEVGRSALLEHRDWPVAFARSTHVVFQSPFQVRDVYRSFIHELPPEKFSVIPNGIDRPAAVKPVPKMKPWRIVCVGSIYPRKRQDDLIQAVHALDRSDLECVLVGKPVIALAKPSQELTARQPDTFRLVGEVKPAVTQAWLASADVFALPSGSESMGLAALEAAVHGVPVVLSDLPAYEGIWRHGHNCLLHPVGDVAMLAWSLRMLLDDAGLRARLGKAAAQTAARFPFEEFAGRFYLLMQRLLSS
jgi:glycosyltransferase involved in cell wall biosynthesis